MVVVECVSFVLVPTVSRVSSRDEAGNASNLNGNMDNFKPNFVCGLSSGYHASCWGYDGLSLISGEVFIAT